LRVGSYSNRSILRQTQASNQWAYFQAKSIKSYLYELQKEKLEMELKQMPTTAPQEARKEYEKKIGSYDKKLKTYEEEKAAIQREARTLESQRDVAVLHCRANEEKNGVVPRFGSRRGGGGLFFQWILALHVGRQLLEKACTQKR
jgi:CRISPR/Cas system-associated exonuclease Cas4 (RecB family)